jgi:antitoxin (DNA-binding transcriptional repressor) of toxin-antitoxin stability system
MSKHRRFPRVLPGEFRNNFGDYLMEISLAKKNFVLSKRGKPMALFTPVEPRSTGKRVTPSQYRRNSSEYLARVRWVKERFIIVKRDRKLAWMRPVEDLGLTP